MASSVAGSSGSTTKGGEAYLLYGLVFLSDRLTAFVVVVSPHTYTHSGCRASCMSSVFGLGSCCRVCILHICLCEQNYESFYFRRMVYVIKEETAVWPAKMLIVY